MSKKMYDIVPPKARKTGKQKKGTAIPLHIKKVERAERTHEAVAPNAQRRRPVRRFPAGRKLPALGAGILVVIALLSYGYFNVGQAEIKITPKVDAISLDNAPKITID
ncbi:MAG: hypothetical protein ACREHG_05035, partial [Candidatus Saccharimonadales bacterium]